MAKRTSTLRNVFDERMFDSLRAASRRHTDTRNLAEYVCEAHRIGWTWKLIGDAIRMSPTTARRIHERRHAEQLTNA